MAAGVEPQSSCSFSPSAPARICSRSAAGPDPLPLPRKPKFSGNASTASIHPPNVPRARRARRGFRSGRRTGAAADQRGDAGVKRVGNLIRRDEVDVGVDRAGGQDVPFAGEHLGGRADFQARRDAVHHARIAGFADRRDAAVPDADVGLVDAGRVDHDDRRDHQVRRTGLPARRRRLAHAVANHLAAAELRLVAVDGPVALDLNDQIGIGQADAIARRGTVVVGVGAAIEFHTVALRSNQVSKCNHENTKARRRLA